MLSWLYCFTGWWPERRQVFTDTCFWLANALFFYCDNRIMSQIRSVQKYFSTAYGMETKLAQTVRKRRPTAQCGVKRPSPALYGAVTHDCLCCATTHKHNRPHFSSRTVGSLAALQRNAHLFSWFTGKSSFSVRVSLNRTTLAQKTSIWGYCG